MIFLLLEDLEGDSEEYGTDHHSNSKNNIFWEMNGGVSDISPREFFYIWGNFGDSDVISPYDAAHADDEP